MKFLIDEDVPVKVIQFLSSLGHDAVRVTSSATDSDIVCRAKKEERILITIDKDFTNSAMYPPEDFDIIHIRLHPPLADSIIQAIQKLLNAIPDDEFKGLIVLQKSGHIRILE